mmetsp:Transcript_54889/g.101577  ORF Transcript_54889/g.101577 Transcript_54889/m.101577 type:complete len:185 (+) Transcript_54889:45-599(+)
MSARVWQPLSRQSWTPRSARGNKPTASRVVADNSVAASSGSCLPSSTQSAAIPWTSSQHANIHIVHRHHHHHYHHHYYADWGDAAVAAHSESLREFTEQTQKGPPSNWSEIHTEHEREGEVRHLHHHTHIAEKVVPPRVRWLLDSARESGATNLKRVRAHSQRRGGADHCRTPGLAGTQLPQLA